MDTIELVVAQIAGDCVEYGEARSCLHYQIITLSHHDTCIHDPRFDESGISKVDPSYYNTTQETVDRIIAVNSELIQRHNELHDHLENSMDSATGHIQQALGVTTGDLASHYFSDDQVPFDIGQKYGEFLANYALSEMQGLDIDLQLTKPGQSNRSDPTFG